MSKDEMIFRKPDRPGVFENPDGSVSLYVAVSGSDGFSDSAQSVFDRLRESQTRFPNQPRILYVDIDGHSGERAGSDPDFFEFQQEFLLGMLGCFFAALDLPLTGKLGNPEEQRNDLPDRLEIGPRKGK